MNNPEAKKITQFYHSLYDQGMNAWQKGDFDQASQFFQLSSDSRALLMLDFQLAGIKDPGNHEKAIVYTSSLAEMAKLEKRY
jgi:hypothetical protein